MADNLNLEKSSMPRKGKTRLGFQLKDGFHAIISILETNNGELLIFPTFAENYSETELGNPNAEDPIVNQHYTIHNSLGSIEKINVIKHTLETVNNEPKITRIFTRAFKQNNLLCPLYIARCPDLSLEKYKVRQHNKDTLLDLGIYLPKKSTVYYMVIVGRRGTSVRSKYKDINIITVDFQKYSVTIFWSFGAIPSHSTGFKVHFTTFPEIQLQINEGFIEKDIVDFHRYQRQLIHLSFLKFIKNKYKNWSFDLNIHVGIGFKKSSDTRVEKDDLRSIKINYAFHFLGRGELEARDGNSKEAFRLYGLSKEIFKGLEEHVAYSQILNLEGKLYHQMGNPECAKSCLKEALDIYRKYDNRLLLAIGYLDIAFVFRDISNFDEAIYFTQKTLEIAEKNGYKFVLTDAKKELAILHMNKGQGKKALKFISEAAMEYKCIQDKKGEAFCLGNMGLIHARENDFVTSLKFHEEALALFTDLNNQWGIANEIANVGNMNCVVGDFNLGLKQLNEALERHKLNGFQYGIATDLKLIGIHKIKSGNLVEGIQLINEAIRMLINIGNSIEAENLTEAIGFLN